MHRYHSYISLSQLYNENLQLIMTLETKAAVLACGAMTKTKPGDNRDENRH
jgi:hypothetical protein